MQPDRVSGPDPLAALMDPENAPARHGEWHPAHRPMGRESVVLDDTDGCSLFVEPWEVAVLVNRAVDAERAPREGLRDLLIQEHRKVIGEFSGNFGGHVGVRDGWVEYDDDTPVEDCGVCAALEAPRD